MHSSRFRSGIAAVVGYIHSFCINTGQLGWAGRWALDSVVAVWLVGWLVGRSDSKSQAM